MRYIDNYRELVIIALLQTIVILLMTVVNLMADINSMSIL